ncbi:MAG: CDP-glycerol glycerophosphotransferase family protein [Actinomycetes bacterium]|jgi:CDP-glycerol glycerophosphotransferase|nr:CDP-glycerol glycerophosphotransferase family protein [Actinomycetes bacterium]
MNTSIGKPESPMPSALMRSAVEGRALLRLLLKLLRLLGVRKKAVTHKVRALSKPFDRRIAGLSRRILAANTKLQHDSVMFLTYQGDFTCNPKYIASELIDRGLGLKLYWATRENPREVQQSGNFPNELTLVKRGTYEFYKACAQSKVFVDNAHNFIRLGVPKRSGQYLLQTWHGSLGIKRLDGDVVAGKNWNTKAKKSRRLTDYVISNSSFESKVFQTSYWEGVPVLNQGHARNDILLSKQHEDDRSCAAKKARKQLDIPPQTRIAFYAPTHRDHADNLNDLTLDYPAIVATLQARFGGEWVIVLRFHHRLKPLLETGSGLHEHCTVDATDYPDIQEIMLAADIGITDYSSWIFDYLLLRKPGFLIAPDLDTFESNRSFYYPIESTPFPLARSLSELLNNIKEFDEARYYENVDKFLADRGCFEQGNAASLTADTILDLLNPTQKN